MGVEREALVQHHVSVRAGEEMVRGEMVGWRVI